MFRKKIRLLKRRISFGFSFDRKKRKVRRIVFASFALVSTLTLIFFAVFKTSFFGIKSVDFSEALLQKKNHGVREYLSPKIIGKNIFSLEIHLLVEGVLGNFPWLKAVEIRKKYPSKVVISIIEREPLAVLSAKNGNFIVDETGEVFCQAEGEFGLPKVMIGRDLKIGDLVNTGKIKAHLAVLSALKKGGFEVSEVLLKESSISALLKEGPSVIFNLAANFSEKISLLRKILQKYKIEGTLLRKVDLRFEKPVVSF